MEEPSKYVCEMAFGSTNILLKIVAGGLAGSFATALTNPTKVLKVRLQMNSGTNGGAIRQMCRIASDEGITALWKGVGLAMARAASLTASQLATYDESKRVKYYSWCNTLVTAHMDMVKTRLMLQRGSSRRNYKNGFHCAYQAKLSERVLELLALPDDGEPRLLLDIG